MSLRQQINFAALETRILIEPLGLLTRLKNCLLVRCGHWSSAQLEESVQSQDGNSQL